MTSLALPSMLEGRLVRLRPIARSDHPEIFAQRISLSQTRLHLLGPPVPTFERCEATELQEMPGAGPAFVLEDHRACCPNLQKSY